MKGKIFIALIIVISLVLIIYTWLGGFQKAVIEKTTLSACTLMGKDYIGNAKSEKLGEIFVEIQNLKNEGKISGTLAVIYFSIIGAKEDSVHAFVGIIVKDSTTQVLPKDFIYKTLPSQQGLQARLNINSLVLTAEKIENTHLAINEFAQKEKIKLQPIALEKYFSESEFVMEIPEKK